ncbi:hypothetical protein FE633_19600 [Streptomyces montanus]|uniref:Exo-alpha-sialidase n=1 Tax=Streptomyces montanus TaxID=2580423 RepID=A0A5R9FQZ2_9ACTN|nr:hypothetical protein [Streptomyces montanus]TLS44516.1 hypothetical protein FE633_19600 [Streptomyces montanus]
MRRITVTLAVLALAAAGCAGKGGQEGQGSQKGQESQSGQTDPSGGGGGSSSGPAWTYDEIFDSQGLSDVVALAEDDIWVAGATEGTSDGFLLRYDGKRWQRQPMPTTLGESVHEPRLDPLGSGEVLLTAGRPDQSASRMAHWDGTRWSAVPELPDGRPVADLKAFSADDIWVLSRDSRILHWDGTRWTTSALPATAASLDGSASDDLWAVGYRDGESEESGHETAQPAALHWDGRAWTVTPTPEYRFPDPVPPEPTATLDEVLVLAKDDVRAYGTHTFNHGEVDAEPQDEAVRLRWDGSRWSRQPDAERDCATRVPVARDGTRGLFLDGNRYLAEDGACTKIKRPRLPNTGGVRPSSQQSLWLSAVEPVPGTDKVLGVGHVQVNQSGNPMAKSVIVSLKR